MKVVIVFKNKKNTKKVKTKCKTDEREDFENLI